MGNSRKIGSRLRSRIAGWHRARYLNRPGFAATESRIVWIFGSPRSGSTWLLEMLAEACAPGVATIDETWAGELFNRTFAWPKDGTLKIVSSRDSHATLGGWVLAAEREPLWAPVMRAFLLEGFEDQLAHGQARTNWEHPHLVIKEPNSSDAADTLVSLLPRSRVLFLLRDGRDVIDSMADHFTTASWGAPKDMGWDTLSPEEREKLIVGSAAGWVYRTEAVQRACALVGPGAALTVRYEDLLADTTAELERIARWIGVETPAGWAGDVASRHAFERIPKEQRGSGKFHRAATPGLWREHMTAAEQDLMSDVMGEKLRELGYEPS
ncbi:MAG: sulfotransferase [Solirubrobacterales bacterium]